MKTIMKSPVTRTGISVLMLLAAGLLSMAQGQVGNNMGVVNPNQASDKELMTLPHMTGAIVKSIMDNRPFLGMSDLNAMLSKSLKKEQLGELYVKLFLPINLNSASEEEIYLVPGIGKKMAHEFEEYRPYKHIAQFRREMGKYIDKEEVARFEQYVFVPIHINTASDEDIMTIPGLGKKMLGEFKEYRPFKSMAQFRREIGKYVDDKELARLERYVTLD